jgi:hypothetical protein
MQKSLFQKLDDFVIGFLCVNKKLPTKEIL